MAFTQAQKAAIKADILASVDLKSLPTNSDGSFAIADLYNLPAVPDYIVWNTRAETKVVMDAITWANLTPSDAVADTTIWLNRALACQGKQFNIQTILVGRETIDAARTNIRAGLQDALTNVPSGAGGALVSGGWASVKIALTRKATRLEKLLATGSGTATSPSTMNFEGSVSYQEIDEARV